MKWLLYTLLTILAFVIIYNLVSSDDITESFWTTNCIRNVFGRKVCYPPGIYPWYPYGYYPQRHTRLMSYDYRGDPYYIPKKYYYWNNADTTPYWYL
jgi:hypothetical protein